MSSAPKDSTVLDKFSLAGRLALITGGGGQLAYQYASAFAEMGAQVILWDIDEAQLEKAHGNLSKKHPGQIHACQVDIVKVSSVEAAVTKFPRPQYGLDVLVNNASLTVRRGQAKFDGYFNRFEDYPLELWELALQVNLTGTFIVTQQLVPLLKMRQGTASIINVASDVGIISPDHRLYRPNPEHQYPGVSFNTPLSYAVSKASLIHMTKYWATYWAQEGIRVNSISPAGVDNPTVQEAFKKEFIQRIPMGRMAEAHELKSAVLYLASDASSFVTGANLVIDGGRTIW